MTHLQPQLGETRRQELRNSPFWHSLLFKSQLVKEGEEFLLKKAPLKTLRILDPIKTRPQQEKRLLQETPLWGNSSQSSYQTFSSGSGKTNFRGSRGRFRPHCRGGGRGNCLLSFRRDWQTNKCSSNVLNIITNGHVLPFISKPNLVRFPLIQSEYKALQKDQALATFIQSLLSKNAIKRVKNVKSLRFYSLLFLVPKPVIDLSRLITFLLVKKKNGNSRIHQYLPDSRGMGIVDR